jgi:hypothetical protein
MCINKKMYLQPEIHYTSMAHTYKQKSDTKEKKSIKYGYQW